MLCGGILSSVVVEVAIVTTRMPCAEDLGTFGLLRKPVRLWKATSDRLAQVQLLLDLADSALAKLNRNSVWATVDNHAAQEVHMRRRGRGMQ